MRFQKERKITTKVQYQNTKLPSENHPQRQRGDYQWHKEWKREERIVRTEYRKHSRDPTNTTKLRSFQCRRAIKQSFQEKADRTAKQVIDMPGMTARLHNTDYYLTIRKARNFEWKRKWENNSAKLHYIKPRIEEWENAYNSCWRHEVKLSRIRIGHTRQTHRHLMSGNN